MNGYDKLKAYIDTDDFIEEISKSRDICPNDLDLDPDCNCYGISCTDCWKAALNKKYGVGDSNE